MGWEIVCGKGHEGHRVGGIEDQEVRGVHMDEAERGDKKISLL